MKDKDIKEFGLRTLARREYSVREFFKKLKSKFPDNEVYIENLVGDFVKKGWLSDERFAEAFIRDQIIKKNGPQKILQKLVLKGVDREFGEEILISRFDEVVFEDLIKYLKEKKKAEILRRKPDISDFELNGKVMVYLRGRGF